MSRRLRISQLFILLCISLHVDLACSKTLLIGVVAEYPPYSYFVENNPKPTGIGVDIWEEIARRLNITDYKYVSLDSNFNQNIVQLSQGKYDFIASPLFITKKRFELVDFAETIAVAPTVILLKKDQLSLLNVLHFFVSNAFLYSVLGYLLLLIIYTHWIWLLERGRTLPASYHEFSDRVIWTLLLYGQLETLPQRWGARALELIWKVVGYILLSLLISLGTVTIIGLTTHLLQQVETLDDLRNKRIAGEFGAQEYENVKQRGLNPSIIQNLDEGFQLIENDKLDGIALNQAEAQYFINKKHLNNELYVAPIILGRNLLSFPIVKNSPLLNEINKTILDLQSEGYTSYVCSKYMNLDSALCIGN